MLWQMRKTASNFYKENKTFILVALGAFLLWKLRGLFSFVGAAGDTVAAKVAAVLADAKNSAQASTDQKTVTNGLPANTTYKATAADTTRYRAVAEACAVALGTMPGQLRNVLITDDASLFSAIKFYGKARLGNGGLAVVDAKGVLQLRPLTGRYDHVIAPFYRELTGGNLQVDLDSAFPSSPGFAASWDFKARCSFYRKYVRV